MFVALIAAKLDCSWFGSIGMIGAGYVLQDVAHWYYGEETYQQNSWGSAEAAQDTIAALFVEHCYFLLPLTLSCASAEAKAVVALLPVALVSWANYAIDSDSKWGIPFLSTKTRLLVGKFKSEQDRRDLAACRSWCVARKPNETMTSHWWVSDLDSSTRQSFERIVESDAMRKLFEAKFHVGKYVIEPVRGMNELYVSAPLRNGPKNSDDVFFTEHVDGPFCFFPFASLFRCIVALDENAPGFTTHFPNAHQSITAKTGDILAFDFHRESHYITKSTLPGAIKDERRFRIVLKLHYVVAPVSLFWCCGRLLRWLSVKYNQLFRALFLATIAPTSRLASIVADIGVIGFTVLYNAIERYVGYANLTYYATVSALALATRNFDLFLYATQYIHYMRYMYTYYDRDKVAFGQFKRDALLYKSVALCSLFLIYISSIDRIASLALVLAGYAVSIAATAALGVDGTYFGIELGHVKADYRFVTKFPYNFVPHPMILGQCVAILGMHVGSSLRRTYPLLAPIHIVLYLIHLIQEAYDFHAGKPWYLSKQD